MDTKNWNQITMTGPTEEDYRRYDQVVGEIIGHIVNAVNADGITTIENAQVIFRGYENLISKLKNLNINAKIIL